MKAENIRPDVLLDQAEYIETVLVGKEKMSLSLADKDKKIIAVYQSFGPFIKLSAQLKIGCAYTLGVGV